VVAVLLGGSSGTDAGSPGQRRLPVFDFPEPAVRALAHVVRCARWRHTDIGHPLGVDCGNVERARDVIAACLERAPDGGWADPAATSELLGSYGIGLVVTEVAASVNGALKIAARLGYPVVLKTTAPGVVHKTDVGGVRGGLRSPQDVRTAYDDISLATKGGDMVVLPMIGGATTELVVGVVAESSFGPIVMLGLGGVATDVLGDRTFRAAPVSDMEARQMVLGLKAAPLLLGYRGAPPADVDAIVDLLQRVGRLAADHPEVVELDLNPVLVRPGGLLAVDARLRLAPPADAPDSDLRRLRS